MSLLNNAKYENLGTAGSIIYTVPAGKKSVLIGGNISNKLTTVIYVDVMITSETKDYVILKDLAIPSSAAFSFSGFEQKLVLGAGDAIKLKSSANNSSDVWLSLSELEV